MKQFKILTSKEELQLSNESLLQYYQELRSYLLSKRNFEIRSKIGRLYGKLAPFLRKYEFNKSEICGIENIPSNESAIFYFNHSNSHDFYTIEELFSKLGRKVSVLVGSDCLNKLQQFAFYAGNSVLINRNNPISCINGENELVRKVLTGTDVVIFGEGTWNLHPTKPMLPLRWGGVTVAKKSENRYVIPSIMEYIERDSIVSKESEIYEKCIICFGKPILINSDSNIKEAIEIIEKEMIEMRKKIWTDNGINKQSLNSINPDIYINHTMLKKNTPIFKLNADYESKFIRKEPNQPVENEFYINENGNLIPKTKMLTKL